MQTSTLWNCILNFSMLKKSYMYYIMNTVQLKRIKFFVYIADF